MNFKQFKEKLIKSSLFLAAVSSIIIVFFIIYFMLDWGFSAISGWVMYGFTSGPSNFYAVPFIFNSVYIAVGGTLLGIAIGIPCAIYMAEFADFRWRNIIKPTLEVLNGFPSVVIGLLGFTILVSQITSYGLRGFAGVLFAWIILGIMALPLIASVSEDAIRAVPNDLKEASLGLGATQWQTTVQVLIPGAISGILTAVLLAFAASIGETVAIMAVIGPIDTPLITLNPLTRSSTLTTFIASVTGDAGVEKNTPQSTALFAAAFLLFILTALINVSIRTVIANRNKKNRGGTS